MIPAARNHGRAYHNAMLTWAEDLRLSGNNLYLDSRSPRARCFVSHAHSDHLGVHAETLCTPATAVFARHRLRAERGQETGPPGKFVPLDYAADHRFDADTSVRLLPAGHVLGSAMLHVTRPEGTLLYTGDFKLRQSLTVPTAAPEPADFLVMESTYGQPHFRFPPWREVAVQLVEVVERALRAGRQPIVLGYSLGKAQEITRILTDAGFPVTLHGAAHSMAEIHRRLGVELGPYRRYAFENFHGPKALDLAERGVLVAPPSCARSAFCTRFDNPCRIVMTGWALLKNAIYRYGVEHALPLSDHADFDELMELIERVGPKKIFSHHGYGEFADLLRAKGFDAELARPDAQRSLFE
jgi:putative mRNA 3-end processing factor